MTRTMFALFLALTVLPSAALAGPKAAVDRQDARRTAEWLQHSQDDLDRADMLARKYYETLDARRLRRLKWIEAELRKEFDSEVAESGVMVRDAQQEVRRDRRNMHEARAAGDRGEARDARRETRDDFFDLDRAEDRRDRVTAWRQEWVKLEGSVSPEALRHKRELVERLVEFDRNEVRLTVGELREDVNEVREDHETGK